VGHSGRVGMYTAASEAGIAIEVVAVLARHISLNVAQRYPAEPISCMVSWRYEKDGSFSNVIWPAPMKSGAAGSALSNSSAIRSTIRDP
jgi:hypothetical protein